MAKIITYVISCSAGSKLNVSDLYVWGEYGKAGFLPESKKEALERIQFCKLRRECSVCDAYVHRVVLDRKRMTYKQGFSDQEALEIPKEGEKKTAHRCIVKCDTCGKEKEVYFSQITGKHHFCDRKCYAEWQRNRRAK